MLLRTSSADEPTDILSTLRLGSCEGIQRSRSQAADHSPHGTHTGSNLLARLGKESVFLKIRGFSHRFQRVSMGSHGGGFLRGRQVGKGNRVSGRWLTETSVASLIGMKGVGGDKFVIPARLGRDRFALFGKCRRNPVTLSRLRPTSWNHPTLFPRRVCSFFGREIIPPWPRKFVFA
jgi:hypothetical protein